MVKGFVWIRTPNLSKESKVRYVELISVHLMVPVDGVGRQVPGYMGLLSTCVLSDVTFVQFILELLA